jgi:hypothetical protein
MGSYENMLELVGAPKLMKCLEDDLICRQGKKGEFLPGQCTDCRSTFRGVIDTKAKNICRSKIPLKMKQFLFMVYSDPPPKCYPAYPPSGRHQKSERCMSFFFKIVD